MKTKLYHFVEDCDLKLTLGWDLISYIKDTRKSFDLNVLSKDDHEFEKDTHFPLNRI